jgi:hypothetical protein
MAYRRRMTGLSAASLVLVYLALFFSACAVDGYLLPPQSRSRATRPPTATITTTNLFPRLFQKHKEPKKVAKVSSTAATTTSPLQEDKGVNITSRTAVADVSITSSTAVAEDDADSFLGTLVSATTTTTTATRPTRLCQLKDLVWVRESLEDLTAAEFALSVEAHSSAEDDEDDANNANEERAQRRKRAVDYEKLLAQLNRRMQDLGCDASSMSQPLLQAQRANGDKRLEQTSPVTCDLQANVGMGCTAYTEDQRRLLLARLVRTRHNLMELIRGYTTRTADDGLDLSSFSISLPDLRVEIPREADDPNAVGPKLYVRDDGTVDWDGALQDQAALRLFGGAVWARINGRTPEQVEEAEGDDGTAAASVGHAPARVTARVIETPQIKEARQELSTLSSCLDGMQSNHTALLNSVISAGQAVANVNLASLPPSKRGKIVKSAGALEKMREKVSYETLLYELERIYSYLAGELGNPSSTGYISLQDRLNVAEFGLVESQVETFNRQLESGDSIDADILAVVTEQLNDFKRRLGIDYFVTGVTFDREAIARWLSELTAQTKSGLAFYVKGIRLFWNDIVFCLNLVSRAAQGYTLKPREVRTIRYVMWILISWRPRALHGPNTLLLFSLSTKTNIQGCLDHDSIRYHLTDSSESFRACSCLWCNPTILPRLFPELLYRTAPEPPPAI